MPDITTSTPPASGSAASGSSASDSGWKMGPLNDSYPASSHAVGEGGNEATIRYGNGFTGYDATVNGQSYDLRQDSGGVTLTLADGRQVTLPDAKVALEGGSLMIKVNGQTLTLEQAFDGHAFGQGAANNAPPGNGSIPASGSPQPAPGDFQQVPPPPGTGNGAEPTNNQPAPLW
jgi:hypothetical protein